MTKKEFGDRIRKIRGQQKLSQMEFAMQCSLPPGHFANIELGVISPGLETVSKIANGLGVSLSELLSDEEPIVPNHGIYINKVVAAMHSLDDDAQKSISLILKSIIARWPK